jgi:hypothetical protein
MTRRRDVVISTCADAIGLGAEPGHFLDTYAGLERKPLNELRFAPQTDVNENPLRGRD